jgi:glycosyltransferase involved in cell wall biosynthesis
MTSSPKRICLITSEQLSTNPRVIKEADALQEAGYDVRVVSCQWMNWPRAEAKNLVSSRHWRSQIIDYSLEFSPRLFWLSRMRRHLALRFSRLISAEKVLVRAIGRIVPEIVQRAVSEPADLFIGHNLAGLPAAILAARKCGVPAAFDAEDMHSSMWLYETGPKTFDCLVERLERRFLPQCRYVTAASTLIADAYAQRYGIPVPQTILNVFPLGDRPSEFRERDFNSPLTLYWFSQVIGARRGLEDVIRAMGLTGSHRIQLHLRGQWQPGYEQELRGLARTAGVLDEQIVSHELAPPGEMIRGSAAYDVGLALEQPVSKNRDICLTNKIYTYLLAGNAIVATATQAQRELMNEIPGTGLCYEVGDVKRLATQLRAWEADRNLLDAARRRAWQFGTERYNWELEKQKLVAVVDRIFGTDCVAS